MVFNWFRRQFSDQSEEKQDRQAQPAKEQPQDAEAKSASTEEKPPEVAEDYLIWAKAAYQNIQKQQTGKQGAVAEPVAEEPTEVPAPVEAEAVEETPSVEAEAVEAEAVEEPIPVEAQAQPEPAVEEPIPVEAQAQPEPAEAPAPVEAQAQPEPAVEEPAAPPEESTEAETPQIPVVVSETAEPEAEEVTVETAEPEAEEVAQEEAPAAAPASFFARAEAERQARLQRLAETAIEAPAEEEQRRPLQPTAPTEETQYSGSAIPGLAFDEGFMWSAEILAGQGRLPEDISIEEITWLKKLRQGLDKTRRSLINQLRAIVGQGPLNKAAVMEIEAALLQADVGVEATDYIIEALQQKLKEEALPPAEAIAYLKKILRDMLDRPFRENYNPIFVPEKEKLNIWLITGVNGAGKTTTIGKIGHISKKSGYKTLIGAADTFRAAAVEQMKIWGERAGVEVIANPVKNADPAAVVFDAIAAAQARDTELLLVDTAGRLQNKKNLMDELAKVRRIIDKKAPDAVVESLLVLDATLGQNGMRQAEVFSEAVQLSGVILTKLDGTAKGGIALAIVQQMGLPIRFIGAGEGIEDLRPFSSYEFVEALISG